MVMAKSQDNIDHMLYSDNQNDFSSEESSSSSSSSSSSDEEIEEIPESVVYSNYDDDRQEIVDEYVIEEMPDGGNVYEEVLQEVVDDVGNLEISSTDYGGSASNYGYVIKEVIKKTKSRSSSSSSSSSSDDSHGKKGKKKEIKAKIYDDAHYIPAPVPIPVPISIPAQAQNYYGNAPYTPAPVPGPVPIPAQDYYGNTPYTPAPMPVPVPVPAQDYYGNTPYTPAPMPAPMPVPMGGHFAEPAYQADFYEGYQPYPLSGTPTVRPAVPFDSRQDAEVLRKAMKGFGTDEKAIIKVLTNRTNAQRQEIAVSFKSLFGKDLIADLKSELSGKFEDLIKALMVPLPEFLAKELYHAMEGVGTNEETIIEIICTATNAEIHAIKYAYERKFGKPLESDLRGETSGSFRRLLTSLCQGNRNENTIVDNQGAFQDAQHLLQAGELTLGTDESTFNAILCSRSYPQLHQIFAEYQRLTGHGIDKAIRKEFSGDIETGLLAIVQSVWDKYGFFAERLQSSMAGAGTNDRGLIRIVVSRSEIDLYDIKNAFQSRYNKTLEAAIEDETSGDYKKCLLSLVSP